MRVDFGLILGIVIECIAFFYYADTLFYRKRSKLFCFGIAAFGYMCHFAICIFGNIIINGITFFVINVFAFIGCFHINIKKAIFQAVMLAVLSAICEFAAIVIGKLGITSENLIEITALRSMILTVIGKSLYIAGIMILTHIFKNAAKYTEGYSLCLTVIPILTILVLFFVMKMTGKNYMKLGICCICAAIDIVVFIINQRFMAQYLENETLRLQNEKDEKTLESYLEMKHLNHDINEPLNVLLSLIDEGNDKAKEYINSLRVQNEKINIYDYTDNDMINIVLSKKMEDCRRNKIQFSIQPIQVQLKFLKNIDAAAIFSNLINNAIEGCQNSNDKRIEMMIYSVNENFVVIKISNSSDKKPVVIDGKLETHKKDKNLHGIGISSVKQALKDYNGTMSWEYDEKEKIFRSTVIIQCI